MAILSAPSGLPTVAAMRPARLIRSWIRERLQPLVRDIGERPQLIYDGRPNDLLAGSRYGRSDENIGFFAGINHRRASELQQLRDGGRGLNAWRIGCRLFFQDRHVLFDFVKLSRG